MSLAMGTTRDAAAGLLHDTARRMLQLSHEARTIPQRAHLLHSARVLNLVGECVTLGSKTIDEAEAWLEAARIFIAEAEAKNGEAKLHGRE